MWKRSIGETRCIASLQSTVETAIHINFYALKYLFDGFFLQSVEIETVEIHNLVPRRHEISNELLSGVIRCVDLG